MPRRKVVYVGTTVYIEHNGLGVIFGRTFKYLHVSHFELFNFTRKLYTFGYLHDALVGHIALTLLVGFHRCLWQGVGYEVSLWRAAINKPEP